MPAIERAVDQAYTSAKGRTVAHLDSEAMEALGVEQGDTVELRGTDRTVVIVAEQKESDATTDAIRIDEFTRRNAGVDPGATVTVESVDPADAESVTLRPAAPQCSPITADHTSMIHNDLLGTPVRAGEQVWVMVGPQQPFGVVVGGWRPLAVRATEPEGAVTVTRGTDVLLESAIDDAEDGTESEVESWDVLRERVFERDGHACRNCGIDLDTGRSSLEAHFVVAPVHGGVVSADNLVTLCRDCHAAAHEHITTPSV
jgi:hypothetical protein